MADTPLWPDVVGTAPQVVAGQVHGAIAFVKRDTIDAQAGSTADLSISVR